jgi:uncharacterized protein (TIGR02145 family)
VPTDAEWSRLTTYLGGTSVAGTKLKSTDWGGTNETGFSALPGGYCSNNGSFLSVGSYGYWWSSTACDSTLAINAALFSWERIMSYDSYVSPSSEFKYCGLSVRCVRN